MDSKRLILATLLSALVLIGFDYFFPQAPAHQPAPQVTQTVASQTAPASVAGAGQATTAQAATAAVADVPDGPDTRIAINAPSVQGSINLRGARLDDLVLKQYRETVKPNSPDVRVLSPVDTKRADYVDFGWRAASSDVPVALPNAHTLWKASGTLLDGEHPLTLSWDNGAGLTFEVALGVDKDYMFTVTQRVHNATGQSIALYPYYRVNRGYTPEETGGMLVHEGPISVIDGRLNEGSYKSVRNDGVPPSPKT